MQTRPPALAATPFITIRRLVKTYPTPAGPLEALRGVDMQIDAGELVGVIGRSGSGKSTLINVLAGIDRLTSGEVWIGSTPVHTLSEEGLARWRGTNVGVVFQFFQLLPTLTLLENVMLPMELCGRHTPRARRDRAMALLERVGLAEQARKLPAAVSGGQQQRAAIARALANEPPLLVADEPTGNLDSRTAETIFALFRELVDAGTTIVMVTHDDEFARRVDRTIVIADGQVLNEYLAQALSALSPDRLSEIARQVQPIGYAPGQVIVREGEVGDTFYVLLDGTADVLIGRAEAAPMQVERLVRGQYFGEMALRGAGLRRATVVASSDGGARVLPITQAAFERLTTESPGLRQEISQIIDRRVAQNALQGLSLLEGTSLRALVDRARVRVCAPGEIVFRQGQGGDGFYVVVEGTVEIVATAPGLPDRVLNRLGPGQHFGAMSLLHGTDRSATARVAPDGPATLVRVSAEDFASLMANSEHFQHQVSTAEAHIAVSDEERRP